MVLLSQSQIRHCPLAMAAPSYGGHESLASMQILIISRARIYWCAVLLEEEEEEEEEDLFAK